MAFELSLHFDYLAGEYSYSSLSTFSSSLLYPPSPTPIFLNQGSKAGAHVGRFPVSWPKGRHSHRLLFSVFACPSFLPWDCLVFLPFVCVPGPISSWKVSDFSKMLAVHGLLKRDMATKSATRPSVCSSNAVRWLFLHGERLCQTVVRNVA